MRSRAGAERALGVVGVSLLLTLPVVVVALSLLARSHRERAHEGSVARLAVVGRLPSADFSFAGGSRHVRFVSIEEPQAAFADGPGLPDPEPAGGLVGVPRAAFADATVRAGAGVAKGSR